MTVLASPERVNFGRAGQRRITVALMNDFDVVVAGLAAMLAPYERHISVVDVSTNRPSRRAPLDVVLYDSYGRPGLDLDRIDETIKQGNVRHVAVFTFDFHRNLVDEALARGVTGYLWKGLRSEELVGSLLRVADGQVVVSEQRPPTHPHDAPELLWPLRDRGLTARESEALALLVQGLRNREIASAMFVSVDTVKTHLANVFRKLEVRNRAEAVALALDNPDFARQTRDLVDEAQRSGRDVNLEPRR
jgi:DNA-binding NarL/FixJ family response regulator